MRVPASGWCGLRCWLPGLVLLLSACGGSGGGEALDIFPLWVPTDVVVADIDGDGRADVITLAQYSTDDTHREGRLSVYRQTSDGAFSAPDVYKVGVYPWRVRVADVDGDGLADLVIADSGGGQVLWMRQDPSQRGRFEAPVVVASATYPLDIAVGDLNHDGAPDIAIADCNDKVKGVPVVYQDPAARGTFLPPSTVATPGPACALSVADIDGDGRDDLAGWFVTRPLTTNGSTITPGAGELGVAWQLPDGTIAPVTVLASREDVNAERVVAADYVGNGAIGLIAYLTTQGGDHPPEVLVALHDPGSREFNAFTGASLQGMQGTDDAAFADLDDDGRVDAVIAGFFPVGSPSSVESRANILRQIGDGTLLSVGTDSLPISASTVAAGDLNGDGRTDIVLYGADNQVVRMLQSSVKPGTFGEPLPLR